MTRWWLAIRNLHQSFHTAIETFSHMRSCGKLKTLYLHYHNVCDHFVRMVIHHWRGPTHKLPWLLDEVILWGQLANEIHYISTCRGPMDTKLSKLLTYHERVMSSGMSFSTQTLTSSPSKFYFSFNTFKQILLYINLFTNNMPFGHSE